MFNSKINILKQWEINAVAGAGENKKSEVRDEKYYEKSSFKGTSVGGGCNGNGCYAGGRLQYDIPVSKHASIAPFVQGNLQRVNGGGMGGRVDGGGVALRFHF